MQIINIDVIPQKVKPVVNLSQYDNNRCVRFALFEDGEEYTLTGDETVEVSVRKIDGNICVITPEIGAHSYIDVYFTEQSTACHGESFGEISINSANDTKIGTCNFILNVEISPEFGGIVSQSEIDNLQTQVEEIVTEVLSDDYYTKTETNELLAAKANASDVYTKTQADTLLAAKANASDVYTKTQADTLLAAKANASDVYTKAETYTQHEVDAIIDSLFPTKTASGLIANFTTGLTKKLVSCTVESGATKITHAGGNFFDNTNVNEGALINGSGIYVSYAGWWVSDYIPVKEGASYYLSGLTLHPNTYQDNFELFDASKTKIGYSNVKTNEYPFIIPNGVKYVRFSGNDNDINTALFGIKANAQYSPYKPIIDYPIADKDNIVTLSGENNLFTDSGNITAQYKEV